MLCRAPQSMKTIKESPLGRGKRHRRWGGSGIAANPPRLPARPLSLRQPPLLWRGFSEETSKVETAGICDFGFLRVCTFGF